MAERYLGTFEDAVFNVETNSGCCVGVGGLRCKSQEEPNKCVRNMTIIKVR